MKKIKWILSTIVLTFVLIYCGGCSASWDGDDTAKKDIKVTSDFIQIPHQENLYYHKDTKIVYWIGGSYMTNLMGDDYTTSYMTPFYAANGKPYIYAEGGLKEIK